VHLAVSTTGGAVVTNPKPNHRLADVMAEANLSNKALARRVRDASVRAGKHIAADHTSVSRWLSGMQPRQHTVSVITAVLSEQLGRAIRPVDVGMAGSRAIPTSRGIQYGDDPSSSVDVLTELWRADLNQDSSVLAAPISATAWSEASLSWLVATRQDRLAARRTGTRIGPSDVATVRATTAAFAQLDNAYGGGHARRALIQFLASDLAAMLDGQYSDGVGRQLYSAAAEATLLAAWMSYDAGIHGLAQRYFIQALRMAQAADDVLLAANVLDAMSHQATFLGRAREAANMARAARIGTQGRSTPGQAAHFYAMEARALAVAGDEAGADHALSDAVRAFERRRPEDDPEWIAYFDDAELSAEFGHCFRDLGRPTDAIHYAKQALSSSSPRSNFFVTMVLADAHVGRDGDIAEACRIAMDAVDLASQLKSARSVAYLRDFRSRIEPHIRSAPVRELTDYAADHPAWQASQR
jgi:tetratricopeptide (TPR) repeat protein